VFCCQDDFTRRVRTFTWRISRILDTVGDFTNAFRRLEDFTRRLRAFTDAYVEDYVHYRHRRRTLLAQLAVWGILGRRR